MYDRARCYREAIVITAVFLPWFVAATCLELAVVFLLIYRYVNAAKSNAIFSFLCLCFACMTLSTERLVHPPGVEWGLFWYRTQLMSSVFAVVAAIHFARFITRPESESVASPPAPSVSVPISVPVSSLASPPSSVLPSYERRFATRLYGLATVIALTAWHPLVLHRPFYPAPVGDYDSAMAGPLFPIYVLLGLGGGIYMCAILAAALRKVKRDGGNTKQSEPGASDSYRAFAGDFRWLLWSFALVLFASVLEFLEALDWPTDDFGLPVFPRAFAVLVFCVTTAWSLGKQVVVSERRKEQLRVVAQTRLESARHTQHQVKNALAQIARPLHNVLDNAPPEQQQTADHRRVVRAVAAVQNLHRTLDVALNLARVEVGEPLNLGVKESIPLAAFVETLCRRELHLEETDSVSSANASQLEFRADLHTAWVFVYADALREVFAVLLDNARKYAPPASRVTVRVWEDADHLHFRVADQGCGVRPEDRQRIFTHYRGQHSNDVRVPGTGLGLTLAKCYVEAQGGQIWVESEGAGKGSAFSFTLPLEPDQS